VRALYASGVNILVTYPDTRRTIEALKSLDFIAVAAHQMTPTAEWADIVLPKTTTLEEEEVSFMPSGPTVLLTRAVVPPAGEARQEIDIAVPLLDRMEARQALAKRLLPWRSQRAFNEHLVRDSDIQMEDLLAHGFHQVAETPIPDDRPYATPTGKIELASTVLADLGLDPVPAYRALRGGREPGGDTDAAFPLTLITGDREKGYHHSRFRDQAWALKVSPDPTLLVHPETARAAGIADGAWVRLEVRGRQDVCRLKVKVSDATPADVVSTGMGWWRPDAPAPERGALDVNINAALSYSGPYDPISGSSDIRGQHCRVVAEPAA
jgi:anaerobic selenocysteine-containing dehydrogenase